jgi:hypothetical protein
VYRRKSKAMEVILMYPAYCTGGTVELTRTDNSEKAEIGALHKLEFVVRLSGEHCTVAVEFFHVVLHIIRSTV